MRFLPPRPVTALPACVLAVAQEQDGYVSRRRLLALGVPAGAVAWWLEAGLLERVSRGHYRLPGPRQASVGRLAAALERAGDGARIGGPWACGLYGLEGFDLSGTDHVVIDPARRVRGVGFRVVRSRIAPVDQAEIHGLPALAVARSLISVAPTHPAKRVRVAFDAANRAGLTTLQELTERSWALGGADGAPQMRAIITSGLLAFESEGERALYRDLWHPGDPVPVPQVWVRCGGAYFRLDFAFLDARLCLEYDGRKDHLRDVDRFRDGHRDLALAEEGIATLRISARMLRTPEQTRRRILAVRAQRLALGLPPIVPCASPRG